MQSSLGIYIEENIIKYAKLQKDRDDIKVEAYNVAFYDNDLISTLNRIISETYSYKVPISVNISDELYSTFEVSSLLSKKDVKKAIQLEYEMMCSEKGYNKSSIEHKYVLVDTKENPEKNKALTVIANKNEIAKRKSLFEGKKVATMTPISTSIANLVEIDGRQNIVIVNIESKTKITTIIDGQLYQIDTLEEGMKEVLDNINKVENSFAKAYDVCRNMSVYTQNSSELYADTSEYMDMVTTTLSKIATETRSIISGFFSNIDKVYITGLGTCINNIDLFFQEYITSSKCEVLKPYFVNTGLMQMPIKEYIEVNSAIALALEGLGIGNKEINFVKTAGGNGGSVLTAEVSLDSMKDYFTNLGTNIKNDFTAPLQSSDKLLIRGIFACVIASVLFVGFSSVITKQIDKKMTEVSQASQKAKVELAKIDSDIQMISTRSNTYQRLIDELTNTEPDTEQTTESGQRVIGKDSIPNLLNRVMFVIPKKVKLTSIENTSSNHIVIKAEAEKYEQLGYFKAVLTTNGILQNVKSTPGQKNGSVVEVTIEGDLP